MERLDINKTIQSEDLKVNSDALDFYWVLNTIIRNKILIIFLTIFGGLIGRIYANGITPIYQGQFRMAIKDVNKQSSNIMSDFQSNLFTGMSSKSGLGQAALVTEKIILESPLVLKPVFDFYKNLKEVQGVNVSNLSYGGWAGSVRTKLTRGTKILTVLYIDKDKDNVVPVLEKVSKEYQKYSAREREMALTKGIEYLENQLIEMEKKSNESINKLQRFSLEHNLGNHDGIPKPFGTRLTSKLGNIELLTRSVSSSNTGLADYDNATGRYRNQFSKLEFLEGQLATKSALLKPNSEVIQSLTNSIDNLKLNLSRPKEILLKYRELKRNAIRDETILESIEGKLGGLKLERARKPNQWEIISKPYVINTPVKPKKKSITNYGLFLGLFSGIGASLILEKKRGRLYLLSEYKRHIPYKLIKTFKNLDIEKSKNSLDLLFLNKSKNLNISSLAIIPFPEAKPEKISFLIQYIKDSLGEKNVVVSNNLLETSVCSTQILLVTPGSITEDELNLLKEELIIQGKDVLGWLFVD